MVVRGSDRGLKATSIRTPRFTGPVSLSSAPRHLRTDGSPAAGVLDGQRRLTFPPK
jgi:hypothetical protein